MFNFRDSELEVTPPPAKIQCGARRSLRYTGDIRTPDLDSPRRRKECLKIIRHESVTLRRENLLLKRKNRRLQLKLQSVKELLIDLQKRNLISTSNSADILVSCH